MKRRDTAEQTDRHRQPRFREETALHVPIQSFPSAWSVQPTSHMHTYTHAALSSSRDRRCFLLVYLFLSLAMTWSPTQCNGEQRRGHGPGPRTEDWYRCLLALACLGRNIELKGREKIEVQDVPSAAWWGHLPIPPINHPAKLWSASCLAHERPAFQKTSMCYCKVVVTALASP